MIIGSGAIASAAIAARAAASVSAFTLTAADLEAIWDVELETGFTAREMMRVMFAALAGKRAGIGSATETYYGADGATERIVFSPDANGSGTPIIDGG